VNEGRRKREEGRTIAIARGESKTQLLSGIAIMELSKGYRRMNYV
jgi:phage terminase large subunit-like protein